MTAVNNLPPEWRQKIWESQQPKDSGKKMTRQELLQFIETQKDAPGRGHLPAAFVVGSNG